MTEIEKEIAEYMINHGYKAAISYIMNEYDVSFGIACVHANKVLKLLVQQKGFK